MTVTEVHLYDVARGEPVPAELRDAITEQQLADWEGEWVPELFKAVQRLRRAGVDAGTGRRAGTGTGAGRSRRCRGCWPIQASASSATG